MYFLNKQDVIYNLEITVEDYEKVIKPIDKLFINFNEVIDEFDQLYKMKIDFAIMVLTEKAIKFENILDNVKLEMKKKQFYIMSLIAQESELIIPNIRKICFDKKKIGQDKYNDYEFLDITKTQIAEFSQLVVDAHYESYFENVKEFQDIHGNLYKYTELKFRISLIKNMINYLKSITFNLK